MKHILSLAIILAMSIMFKSCNNEQYPLSSKLFYGDILRTNDSSVLSNIALDFQEEQLMIYSNAVFGSKKKNFKFKNKDEQFIYYQNTEDSIILCINLLNDTSILINPKPESNYCIKASVDTTVSKQYINNVYKDIETVYNPNNYFNNVSCEGEIYRLSDNQNLSKISLIGDSDTLRIYSNAIFGTNNIYFTKTGISCDLDCYKYSSNDIKDIRIYSSDTIIRIENDEFYAVLNPKDNIDLSFFERESVSTNVSDYPTSGSIYSGEIYATKKTGLTSALDMLSIKFTIEFVSNNKLKTTMVFKHNEEYFQNLALISGTNPTALKQLMGPLPEDETSVMHYYVDINGNIICKDKQNKKIQSKFKKVKHEDTFDWSDKDSGFAAHLRIIKQ